jgi:hypothetical protein
LVRYLYLLSAIFRTYCAIEPAVARTHMESVAFSFNLVTVATAKAPGHTTSWNTYRGERRLALAGRCASFCHRKDFYMAQLPLFFGGLALEVDSEEKKAKW